MAASINVSEIGSLKKFSFKIESKQTRTITSNTPTPPPRVRTGSIFLNASNSPRTSIVQDNSMHPHLKFMNGVAIPNSVVRAQPNRNEEEEYEMRRRSTAAELERILRQFMPHEQDTEDSNLLVRIQKELERRRLVIKAANEKDDEIDVLKEQRRISRRTSRLEPLACTRRSTCESIHRSIQQSEQIQKLITEDFLEHREVEKEENCREITTLSPPKHRPQKPNHKTLSAKARQVLTKAPTPSMANHIAPQKLPVALQIEAKKNRTIDSNQKPNTQPWTIYVQPKVIKSNESIEDQSDFTSSSKSQQVVEKKSSGTLIVSGKSSFIKTKITTINPPDTSMLHNPVIVNQATTSNYIGKHFIDERNETKEVQHDMQIVNTQIQKGQKRSKKLATVTEMQKIV